MPAQNQHSKMSKYLPRAGAGNSILRHRTEGHHSNVVTSVVPPVEETPSLIDNLETFGTKVGTKVWSVLGLTKPANELPPGLSSYGRNLCFLNSVLQCIARAPNLADELAEEVKSCRLQDQCRLALLDAVTEVLQQINVMSSEPTVSVVDTRALCLAGRVWYKLTLAHLVPLFQTSRGTYWVNFYKVVKNLGLVFKKEKFRYYINMSASDLKWNC